MNTLPIHRAGAAALDETLRARPQLMLQRIRPCPRRGVEDQVNIPAKHSRPFVVRRDPQTVRAPAERQSRQQCARLVLRAAQALGQIGFVPRPVPEQRQQLLRLKSSRLLLVRVRLDDLDALRALPSQRLASELEELPDAAHGREASHEHPPQPQKLNERRPVREDAVADPMLDMEIRAQRIAAQDAGVPGADNLADGLIKPVA
jgi:hypothetical protein